MRRFRIRPVSPSFLETEIIAHDAAPVLHLIERMNCREAHIDRDGDYAFSVRLGDNGVWLVFQRQPVSDRPAMSHFG